MAYPASSGTTYSYTVNNTNTPKTFCLTATKNGQSYFITQEGTPLAGALIFDGVSDYINCGNGASLNVGNTLTIAAWIKPTQLAGRFGVSLIKQGHSN